MRSRAVPFLLLLAGCAEPAPLPPPPPTPRIIHVAEPAAQQAAPLPAPLPATAAQQAAPLPAPLPEKASHTELPRIAVLLSAGPARESAEVGVEGEWRIVQAGGTVVLGEGRSGLRTRLKPSAGSGTIEFPGLGSAPGANVLPLKGQGFLLDGRPYPGFLEVRLDAAGVLRLTNNVPFPDYLAGVLAGELTPDSPAESLRAQALLARSYALANLRDLTDDPMVHQAYRGLPSAASLPALRAAVASTEGLRLLLPDGNPLPGYWYHSTCGGHTAEASIVFGVPPVGAYAGVACTHCTSSKYFQWECSIPEEEVRRAVGFGSPVVDLSVARRSRDGRAVVLRAATAAGTSKDVPALQVRGALGANRVRSTLLGSIEAEGGRGAPRSFLFRGRGWGHGVGLCQVGAMALARSGRSAEEILAVYYPGARVVRPAR